MCMFVKADLRCVRSLSTDSRPSTALLRQLFVDELHLLPLSVRVFAHDAHLVVPARDREHVPHLAPTHLPQGDPSELNVHLGVPGQLPLACVSLTRPHFARAILGAACDHFVHQADV